MMPPDPSKDELDILVTEFRNNEFLQHITRQLRKLQEEAVSNAEAEVSHLRTENAQLRAQFALSAMELPGQNTKEVKKVGSVEIPDADLPKGKKGQSIVSFFDYFRTEKVVEKPSTDPLPRLQSIESEPGPAHGKFKAQPSRWQTTARQKSAVEALTSYVSEKAKRHDVFPDKEAMKEQVRRAIQRPQTNVQSFYHSSGWAQFIARTIWFEYVTLAVIAVNAVWIAIDADYNPSTVLTDAPLIFQLVENAFCVFFFLEWTVRFCALESKVMGLKHDSWFVFDGLLLVPMVGETWILPIIMRVTNTQMDDNLSNTSVLKLVRISKIVRMARMVRLLRSVPELLVLIRGIWIAAKSVFFTLCLLMLVVYVFAVAFRQTTEGTETGTKYFRNVPESMKTLLLDGVMPDLSTFMNEVGRDHIAYALLLVVFILMASVTVMNMLIGVLVQVVSVVSAVENEQMKVNFVKQRLMRMLHLSETDLQQEDMLISRKEFEMLLLQPDGAKAMQDIGVDPVGLVDFGDYIFAEAKRTEGQNRRAGSADYISFGKFIDIMLQFRGTNTCTVRDIVDMRKVMTTEMQRVMSALHVVCLQLQNVATGSGATIDTATMAIFKQSDVNCKVSTNNSSQPTRGGPTRDESIMWQAYGSMPSTVLGQRPGSSGTAWGLAMNARPPSLKRKPEPNSGIAEFDSAEVTVVSHTDSAEVIDMTNPEDCALVDVHESELPPTPSAHPGACAIVPAWGDRSAI